MITQGTAFLAGAQIHGKHHLWIVINDPAQHGGVALFVNVTTWSEIADGVCTLDAGEHPFIRHRSWVLFREARSHPVSGLDQLLSIGAMIAKEPASPELVSKIRKAAAATTLLAPRLQALL